MNVTGIYVAGLGVHLPPRQDVARAVAAGTCDPHLARRARIRSVCISEHESGPEMAVRAAREALDHAMSLAPNRAPRVDLVLHASTYFQGHDLWSPASYVQHHALEPDPTVANAPHTRGCLALDIGQLSNGGVAGLEVAAGYLRADPRCREALVTTGDRLGAPGIDRWRTDPGTVMGDAGSAVLLSRRGGFGVLRSLVTVSDPSLEELGRGADPFATAALAARAPIEVERHRQHLVERIGMTSLLERLQAGQEQAFALALEEAGVKQEDVDWFVLPNLGWARMQFQFFDGLGIEPARTTWHWGSHLGHLGAGDQFASLAYLARTDRLRAGSCVAVVGAGGGFSWTVGVLEITRDLVAGAAATDLDEPAVPPSSRDTPTSPLEAP